MMIKKQFEEIHNLLLANKNRKVSTVLKDIEALMARKNNASGQANAYVTEGGALVVFCYYHKRWEVVTGTDAVDYGKKANTATGFNTMCKEGVSKWTKQQRTKKLAESELLGRLAAGEVEVADIGAMQEEFRLDSVAIVPRADEHGYDTSEEALLIAGEPTDEVNTATED